MATASVTNTFVDAAVTAASTMNTNFQEVETFLNSSTVHKDGSKTMTGALDAGGFTVANLAEPTTPGSLASKEYVDSFFGGAIFSITGPVSSSNGAAVLWDTESADVDGWMDVEVDNTTFICPENGIYMVTVAGTISGYPSWGSNYNVGLNRKGDAGTGWYSMGGWVGSLEQVASSYNMNYSLIFPIWEGTEFQTKYQQSVTYTNLSIKFVKLGKF